MSDRTAIIFLLGSVASAGAMLASPFARRLRPLASGKRLPALAMWASLASALFICFVAAIPKHAPSSPQAAAQAAPASADPPPPQPTLAERRAAEAAKIFPDVPDSLMQALLPKQRGPAAALRRACIEGHLAADAEARKPIEDAALQALQALPRDARLWAVVLTARDFGAEQSSATFTTLHGVQLRTAGLGMLAPDPYDTRLVRGTRPERQLRETPIGTVVMLQFRPMAVHTGGPFGCNVRIRVEALD